MAVSRETEDMLGLNRLSGSRDTFKVAKS